MLNPKISATIAEKVVYINKYFTDPIERLGALKLLRFELNFLSKDQREEFEALVNASLKEDQETLNISRKELIRILSAKKSNKGKNFTTYSTQTLVSELMSDFNHLQSFGEIRKKVLDATSRIIEHMSHIKTSKELIEHVIQEIQSIASSNRLLLYEEGVFNDGSRYLDATYAWGSAKYPGLSTISNQIQKLKLYVARKTKLLPYAIPKDGHNHLSAATKVWADKMDPILIANIPKIELQALFSFTMNEKQEFVDLQISESKQVSRANIDDFLKNVFVTTIKNFSDFKEKLKYKIIYQLKDAKICTFYDKEGREIKLLEDGILVKRNDRYEYLQLKFTGPYDIFGLNRDEHDWEKKPATHVELNAAVTKVANVETMALYPMSNLGVLLISDLQTQFAQNGKITPEGKLYLESIRILTDILNQAILVIKNKELIEKYKEMVYQSHVAKFGKKMADLILERGQTGSPVNLPFTEERAVLRFTDLASCTQYAAFLKNPKYFGFLLNALQDSFETDTLKNNGRIVSTQGDGTFNVFESEQDGLEATISSLKRLKHNNQLYNFRIYEEYINEALSAVNYPDQGIGSQQGQDKLKIIKNKFIDVLLNNIATLYGVFSSKEILKDLRLQIYQKIKPLHRKDEIISASTDFYELIKDYSQKLFDITNMRGDKKIEPLFKFAFKVRVGLHNGDVVSGSVASKTANIEISVVGDPVNSASRLESAGKTYGTEILVSEDVMHALKIPLTRKISSTEVEAIQVGDFKINGEMIYFREIDLVLLMGKDVPVRIYELLVD